MPIQRRTAARALTATLFILTITICIASYFTFAAITHAHHPAALFEIQASRGQLSARYVEDGINSSPAQPTNYYFLDEAKSIPGSDSSCLGFNWEFGKHPLSGRRMYIVIPFWFITALSGTLFFTTWRNTRIKQPTFPVSVEAKS